MAENEIPAEFLKPAADGAPENPSSAAALYRCYQDWCQSHDEKSVQSSDDYCLQYLETGQLVWERLRHLEKYQGSTVFKFFQKGALPRVKAALRAALAEMEKLPGDDEFIVT